MKAYKLVSAGRRSAHGNEVFTDGVTYSSPTPVKLCAAGYHSYPDKLVAIMLDPIHANLDSADDAIMLEVEVGGDAVVDVGGMKQCHQTITVIGKTAKPKVTNDARVRFAILCALAVFHEESFTKWAQGWLDRSDRSGRSAGNAVGESIVTSEERQAAICAVDAAIALHSHHGGAWLASWAAMHASKVIGANVNLAELAAKAVRDEAG